MLDTTYIILALIYEHPFIYGSPVLLGILAAGVESLSWSRVRADAGFGALSRQRR